MKPGGLSRRTVVATVTALAFALTLAVPAMAGGAVVTRGEIATFAAGPGLGYNVGGHTQMVRSADGSTQVTIHVTGLDPDQTYVAHVHNQSCDDGEADGHFKQDPGGDSVPPNEIWPGDGPFSPNRAGIANERTTVSYFANDDAIAVVVHLKTDTAAPKIAYVDLS